MTLRPVGAGPVRVTEAEDLEGEVRNAQALAGMLARALARGGRRADRAPVLARELEFALHRAATLDVDDADELLGQHR